MQNCSQELYEIRIKGPLDKYRLSQFAEMSIMQRPNGETFIVSLVRDQAELHGLLSCIGDSGTILLSVRRVDREDDT